jgi:hypothetical protein
MKPEETSCRQTRRPVSMSHRSRHRESDQGEDDGRGRDDRRGWLRTAPAWAIAAAPDPFLGP